ncbi:heme-binding domain-containing protein [Dinghuibacter silviterrae]|uniref:Heme-binding protein n=1 Tax=Dinghuibacter silviterrae TaxID=1539049 RepID=A0A4V3GLE2_9BACT|nr:heme-binding domain-containing protein [Dinghuibacter silviterrae]TDW99212.1 heme-binding protein [Dinghuibacter silviterrae]
MLKKILIGILVFVVLIQLIRPAPNVSSAPDPNALKAHYPLPDSVEAVLRVACYDCHSNHSRYPWFDKVAPVSWLVAYHIKGGKRHLNFDEYFAYPVKRKVKRLKDIAETVENGSMPLSTYTWAHKDAVLTEAQKKLIIDWADSLGKQIADTTQAKL